MATSSGSSDPGAGGCLAVIPARGGSKRLPRKNLLPLGGIPLLAWTIRAALACPRITQAVVSTDSPEIAEAAAAEGLPVPFLRPAHLSGDESGSVDVVLHALAHYRQAGRPFARTVLLQPTSPLRLSSDIGAALDLMDAKRAKAVVSVCETEHPPQWCNALPPDGSLDGFLRDEVRGRRSQDFPTHYRLNGAVYACETGALASFRSFFPPGAYAYVMPKSRSVDIDDELDFRVAEALLPAARSLP